MYGFEDELLEAYEFLIEENMFVPRNLQNVRSIRGRININNLNDKQCILYFRFKKTDLYSLVRCLGIPENIENKYNYTITGTVMY